MGQALYRKYRSKSLAEVVGQEHITDTLGEAVKSGRISHAYLFTGPRGVGKTSIARILAHQINNLDYVAEDNHLDIIEIDAASNRGIDEIRDLREKVYMAPSSGKYKVYIIDEVHMLTTQAFNALLKTLEEPPAHVVFILATTEVHKLPETIVSRTQRYVFRPIETAKVVGHLRYIAKEEKIEIDDEALQLIAEHGSGSFRDSISLLDQAAGLGSKIDRAFAERLIGTPSAAAITALVAALQGQDAAMLVSTLGELSNQGFQAGAIAKQLGETLRASLLDGKPELPAGAQLALLRRLIEIPASHDPARLLEISLLESFESFQATEPAQKAATPLAAAKPTSKKIATEPKPEPLSEPKPAVTAPAQPVEPAKEVVTEPAQSFDTALWSAILTELKKNYNTLYGVMRMAQPTFADNTLILTFRFAFHQKRMNEAKHRKIVGDILKQLTNEAIKIECLYDKDVVLEQVPVTTAKPQADPSLSAISNIFGGGELLES